MVSFKAGPSRRQLVATFAAVIAVVAALIGYGAAPARAAVPDQFAFVLYTGGVVSSGTTPAATTVSSSPTGLYKVVFPGAAAKGGVVHVTAINPKPHWCQVNSFGPSGSDEIVALSCYQVGGAPDYSSFSAIFDSSSGSSSIAGAFGYVDALPTGALVSQYNSAGAANNVTHSATGQWLANFPALSTPGDIAGSWQATAVDKAAAPARCKVTSWTSAASGQTATINCYSSTGAPLDTEFTLTYQYLRSLYGAVAPPKYFGYLWNAPTGGPAATNFNSVLGAGANTLSISGALAVVTFPQLAVTPDDIQVTGSGQSSDFCLLDQPWLHPTPDTVAKDVTCYTSAGAPSSSGFLISDNSAK